MHNKPLRGKTVVLTGTNKTTTVLSDIESLGGQAFVFPLIETIELRKPYDHLQLEVAKNVDWLIFTSQNAVEFFFEKVKRHNLTPNDFHCKVAAVGEKTATLLESHEFQVNFMPSVFSADVFVKEFPNIAAPSPHCMFIRGTKAKDTIKMGLPFALHEWNVYETKENLTNITSLIHLIESNQTPIIIFASPSAVEVFTKHIASRVGWSKAKYAAIGHITEAALVKKGAEVTYKPTTYTMQAVVAEIVKREESRS